MPPEPACRENPERAVYLSGEINQATLDRLTPQINRLRFAGSEPVTLYIDSPGGSVVHAESLWSLLKTPVQGGRPCSVVAVVTGLAASAAARLLAKADYSIAYSHARIHFHGTRFSAAELTTEKAELYADYLRISNDGAAIDIAITCVSRIFFLYFTLLSKIRAHQRAHQESRPNDVTSFIEVLKGHLCDHHCVQLLDKAMSRYRRLSFLRDSYQSRLSRKRREPRSLAEFEAEVIRAIVDYEVRENKQDPDWAFTRGGLDALQDDFRLVSDFHLGGHRPHLEMITRAWKEAFLTPAQITQLKSVPDEDLLDWLQREADGQHELMWYLVVSLCRLLQQGENPLDASRAYWFGIVNEVIGEDLPCLRELIEGTPHQQTTP